MRTTLTLRSDELLYDIHNYGYIEWYKVETSHGQPGNHQLMADITQAGNIDRVARVLDVAYATVVEMLRPLSRRTHPRRWLQNHSKIPDAYRIALDIHDTIDGATIRLLTVLIHEYMVGRVVADWLEIVSPTQAAAWRVKVAETAAAIRDSVSVPLCGATRRPLSPW